MRIGIDFDNTIICYDAVFCELAKAHLYVPADFNGTKRALRDTIRALPEGDLLWQRMQGQVYGKLLPSAQMFAGFKAFITACNAHPEVEVFIVSHKTEYGHFDEEKINLREAATQWLREQGLFNLDAPRIPEAHVFFESTREAKVERIRALACTHFIDDLIEVFESPFFPTNTTRFLFSPEEDRHMGIQTYSSWAEITHACFFN